MLCGALWWRKKIELNVVVFLFSGGFGFFPEKEIGPQKHWKSRQSLILQTLTTPLPQKKNPGKRGWERLLVNALP